MLGRHLKKAFIIKDGAIFISDAHENLNRNGFLNFLIALDTKEIKTPQLFLMGDMFDFLTGYADNTINFYERHISLINKIANEIEVFYVEGNHDFVLSKLFKNVKIFPISLQPVSLQTEQNISVEIAHGDNFLPFFSKYALLFLRLKWFLKIMNSVDILLKFKISNWILNRLKFKKLDYKIKNFKHFITPKMRNYSADIVIEGHYHQGEILSINNKVYVNLPAFASNQSYFIVEYANGKINFTRKSLKGH